MIEADLAVAKAPEDRPADQIDVLEEAVRSEVELGQILFAGYPISVLVGLLVERCVPRGPGPSGKARRTAGEPDNERGTGGPGPVAAELPGTISRGGRGRDDLHTGRETVPRARRRARCSWPHRHR